MTVTADTGTELDRTRFFIDGQWVDPLGSSTHHALEAATEEPLGVASLGTDADIDRAVKAARQALDHGPWGKTTAAERADYMHKFAAALSARAEGTSKLVTQENGMPIGLSTAFNGLAPAGLLQMYAELVKTMALEEVRPSASGATIVRREPVGVVGAIAPWNYPQVLAMMKIAPALAAGCTIVLKPSPETALDSYIMGDAALEAGLPRA
ncbi:MAG TPA: aldehyde dehydrogenase family protein [Streptosporangiaceae bacterium]